MYWAKTMLLNQLIFLSRICIPEGQLHVETDICGARDYVAPEYFCKRHVNEKTDV